MKPFFPLHQGFFGLTAESKPNLLEEIYICIKHLGMTYQDVLSAPTYERRFFISTLIGENRKRNEMMEEKMQDSKNKNARGSRTTTVSGEQLKSKLKSGQIPN